MALTDKKLHERLLELKQQYEQLRPASKGLSFLGNIGIETVAHKLDQLIESSSRVMEAANKLELAKGEAEKAQIDCIAAENETNFPSTSIMTRTAALGKAAAARNNYNKKENEVAIVKEEYKKLSGRVIYKLIEDFRQKAREECGEGPNCVFHYVEKLMKPEESNKNIFYRGIGQIICAYFPNDPDYVDYQGLQQKSPTYAILQPSKKPGKK